jgi:hypothetical protein
MELEASSVAVYDPGDSNLGKHQGSHSNDSGKQIPQELSLSEIMPFEASHESSGIPDQEFQQVESRFALRKCLQILHHQNEHQ